ncbi:MULTISPECIES: flagellar biosynthesis protein FliQ [unclassified Thermosipho (in: thermotogales)]|uniref:flagellar biosynthesis protein FliQ n=1 Tax=unclassified Thermosipho (in: thermotogales) TaxID=2676525 RepID=UPI00094934E8|nr:MULTISPECIES: flagellar biosynthesis protein FliQ [unclassified Thermosipho (in: thermotogales)]ANQ53865.1 flagellar biosynthesis protein FliQ [Thermosipho sp. 1070]APT72312.1 flagellar biosynthesis protein FliQ [Thermosipho sp. 1063]MBT1248003.1 flagellar biosynthetic protein FliQ [Thermosipho sp. 1244]OOC43556.1 flagellar biosynthesis protein FliQ [Thermosipho sp. 1074]OOC46598.1 flagellar biosynthesis protein FliQ [Thermosipho sp. 1223]
MTIEVFLDVFGLGIKTLLTVILPPLLISLLVGLIISIFQAATQINEQTLTFAPRIIVLFLTLLFLGGWMMQSLIDLARNILEKYISMI